MRHQDRQKLQLCKPRMKRLQQTAAAHNPQPSSRLHRAAPAQAIPSFLCTTASRTSSGNPSRTPRRNVRSQPSMPPSASGVGRGISAICSTLNPCSLQPPRVTLGSRIVVHAVFAIAESMPLQHSHQRHANRRNIAVPAHLRNKAPAGLAARDAPAPSSRPDRAPSAAPHSRTLRQTSRRDRAATRPSPRPPRRPARAPPQPSRGEASTP